MTHGISAIQVYTTFGLNDCPQSAWENISEEQIKKSFHVYKVVLNGPRYWVIDKMESRLIIESKLVNFGGLSMRLVAQLKHVIYLLLKNHQPYNEVQVERHTTWIYEKGLPIYELVDPKGVVYVMQSYSVQSHPEQTPETLADLGKVLHLPKGWQFKAGINPNRLEVKTSHDTAFLVQDDYQNTYQRMEKDVLN